VWLMRCPGTQRSPYENCAYAVGGEETDLTMLTESMSWLLKSSRSVADSGGGGNSRIA